VLVEIEIASPTALPLEDGTFDLAVVDDTADFIGDMRPEGEVATIREIDRILRPGGRVVFIGTSPARGAWPVVHTLAERPAPSGLGQASALLKADGFLSVRQLADRDGLVFVEAIKPR